MRVAAPASEARLDLAKTQLQETGSCRLHGLSWADLYRIARDLGIDADRLYVVGSHARGELVHLPVAE